MPRTYIYICIDLHRPIHTHICTRADRRSLCSWWSHPPAPCWCARSSSRARAARRSWRSARERSKKYIHIHINISISMRIFTRIDNQHHSYLYAPEECLIQICVHPRLFYKPPIYQQQKQMGRICICMGGACRPWQGACCVWVISLFPIDLVLTSDRLGFRLPELSVVDTRIAPSTILMMHAVCTHSLVILYHHYTHT